MPQGEVDGPLGTTSLARALWMGLGGRPAYVAEEAHMGPIIAASESLGIAVPRRDIAETGYRPSAILIPFPVGEAGAAQAAAQILDEYHPRTTISIENLGPKEKGITHSAFGVALPSDRVAHTHLLVEEAKRRGILTIGIGDIGNELGFGLVHDQLKEIQLYGKVCRCPCQSGVITTVTTDVLIFAAISNWGAYGVSACLALLKGTADILHSPEDEGRMFEECWRATGVDGRGLQKLGVDNISPATQPALITMLHMIIADCLSLFSTV